MRDEKRRGLVVCRLPKTGLGNQLFPMMRAIVFAHLNNLPFIIVGYNQFRIGPYLRGEKSKRNYANYFTFQKGLIGEWFDLIKIRFFKPHQIIDEPPLKVIGEELKQKTLYRFNSIPSWNDYFFQLKDHRQLVKDFFDEILTAKIKDQLHHHQSPLIGVHIRMGDFKKLAQHQDFSKVGATRTPENYFINVIHSIRQVHGSSLPVSVFTDGFKHEFGALFSLENVSLVEGNSDINDLLLLSKSQIIVTSAASTFSYWAGFLSDAPLILHPDHIHESIRGSDSSHLYEGAFDVTQPVLINQLKSLKQ